MSKNYEVTVYVHNSKTPPPPCTLLANPPPPLACVRLLWMAPYQNFKSILFTPLLKCRTIHDQQLLYQITL